MYIAAWIALMLVGYVTIAYILALGDICFTLGKEGAAKAVVKGSKVFDHMLMWWRGHHQNDPRRWSYDPRIRPWEVTPYTNAREQNKLPSLYAWWQIHWKFLEFFGIYWYGLFPFKQIYVYEFQWTEQAIDDAGKNVPWHRQEYTDFIYVKNFAYWFKLSAAEDLDNEPLDLDYLLTMHINNPYRALFGIEDWLGRTEADANNMGKIFVGSRTFDVIKRESMDADTTTSDFASHMISLNDNLITEPTVRGTKLSYGATINGASLVEVNPAGVARDEIARALVAKRIAEHTADATVAKAKGDADAARERAKGEADAIQTVYDKVKEYGDLGMALQQLDTLKQAATSPGSTVIWANNPIAGLANWFAGKNSGPATPTPPPSTPT